MLGRSPAQTSLPETVPADFEIRPSPLHFLRIYVASLGLAMLGPVGLIVGAQYAAHPQNSGLMLRTFLLVAVPTLALTSVFALKIRVRIRGDEGTHVGWRGTVRFPAQTADRVFKYSFVLSSRSIFRLYVVRGASGRCLLALFGMVWKDSDLDRLAARLGLHPFGWEQVSFYKEAREDCPEGGLPLFVQHPVIYGILTIPIGLALFATVGWLVMR